MRAFMLLPVFASLACGQNWTAQSSGTAASLRGVNAASRTVVWASGSAGTYLRTMDGGVSWHAATVPGASGLDFRSVRALDSNTAWLMSSGPGDQSRIYKTADGGAHWSLLYINPDADGFLDALAFWDERRGIVLGDPVGGQFVILTTRDGGDHWLRRKVPQAQDGEGAFAASNSCLVVRGRSEVWFGTGGPSGARVFHSRDGGETWTVAQTPLQHDGAGAGIFSLAFADALRGVAVGGDYNKPAETTGNFALTSDGGLHWAAAPGPAGYRSAAAHLTEHKLWVTVGTSGSDISSDGQTWTTFDTGAFNALAVFGDDLWAVGPRGRIAKWNEGR